VGTEAYDHLYTNRFTGEAVASTTPMPCNLDAAEYNVVLNYRDADNKDQQYGTLRNGATGEVRNPGYVLTNNKFLRLYQKDADPELCTFEKPCQNVASRMIQKEALHHSQAAYFMSIIIVQWAGLLVCKTRRLSLISQGMSNSFMNFGLMSETLLGSWMCYCPPLWYLGTRPLRLSHLLIALPSSMMIVVFDEVRKYCIRATTTVTFDKITGAVIMKPGWMERNTYY
jgi:hypothetical protein